MFRNSYNRFKDALLRSFGWGPKRPRADEPQLKTKAEKRKEYLFRPSTQAGIFMLDVIFPQLTAKTPFFAMRSGFYGIHVKTRMDADGKPYSKPICFYRMDKDRRPVKLRKRGRRETRVNPAQVAALA